MSNHFPSKEIVQRLQAKYPPGTRVRLTTMDDPSAPLPGTMGTVRGLMILVQ